MSPEDFDYKCEPEWVKLSMVRFEKKVIGATLYTVRIEVNEQWGMQCETKKTLEEFKVFHQCVSISRINALANIKVQVALVYQDAKQYDLYKCEGS